MAWKSEQAVELEECWKAGMTSGEIATRLGVTRNAVIGKAGRLGLLGERQKKEQRVAPTRKERVIALGPKTPPSVMQRVETVLKVGEADKPSEGNGISLVDLRAGVCHWPIPKRDKSGLRMYCGAHAPSGTWCGPHKMLSVRKD